MIGKTLAHYEISSQLGKGGMGEVYQATDKKLGRSVAIKVLPQEFAQDADRVARLQREAKLLASLNHPNIAAIYGLEESDGTNFLVMELVEGQTLDAQIKSGLIPVEETLKLALQITEALEAAHEKGVIHRDLKPANIKVTPDGKLKVLDFGLAKAFAGEQSDLNLSNSPTLSVAATQQGMILGTAAYMSPEQARGKEVDKRSDIWAFGVVLFEMLTGRQVFTGDTVSDTLASVLAREPKWESLPKNLHPRIRLLLHRCLQKDPQKRLRDAADVALEIEEAIDAPIITETAQAAPWLGSWRRIILLGAITVLIGLVIGWIVRPLISQKPSSLLSVVHSTIVMPQNTELPQRPDPHFVISPDGTYIAFVARSGNGETQLYLRSIDSLNAQAVPGSENADLPFFSPDGKWIAYFSNTGLYKVSVEGPIPIRIGELPFPPRGASWGLNNTIYIGGFNRGLYRIAENGGETVEITHPDKDQGEQYHAWPDALPDGKHVLFTSVQADDYEICSLSLETGKWRILGQTKGAGQPHYLNSGHLVYFREHALFAAPFDSSLIALEGQDAVVLQNISWGFNAGLDLGYFSVSRSGSLIYIPASGTEEQHRLVLMDRDGYEEELPIPSGRYYSGASFSPTDENRLLYDFIRWKPVDVYVFDRELGTRYPLTSQGDNISPIWSHDGKHVIFSSFMRGASSFDLYWASSDGSGKPGPLLIKDHGQFPSDVSPDGRLIAFTETHPKTGDDIYFLQMDDEYSEIPVLITPEMENDASFSPDGRFLAYVSNKTGRSEVYVRPVSGEEFIKPISNDGGYAPKWSSEGDELFYLAGDRMMSVQVSTSSEFNAEKPRELFRGINSDRFDVAADGQHFLMLKRHAQPPVTQIQYILNWFEELKEKVPVP